MASRPKWKLFGSSSKLAQASKSDGIGNDAGEVQASTVPAPRGSNCDTGFPSRVKPKVPGLGITVLYEPALPSTAVVE